MTVQLIHGDCLDVLKTLDAGSIDAIITDLPYGTTACKWDEVIPFAPMWEQVKRLLKPRGAFVTTASQPFTSKLVMSNLEWFRYVWIWEKTRPSGFVHCKIAPLKSTEDILVFGKGVTAYNPQMTSVDLVTEKQRTVKAHLAVCQSDRIRAFTNNGLAYPRTILRFPNPNYDTEHPTQKPVALYEYLIRTYTDAGDTVLDFTMGSGTTGVACVKTGRNFIGIELDPGYFAIAEKRIAEAQLQLPLLEV